MQFNVAQLLRQTIGATRRYEIDEPAGINDPDLTLIGPIRGDVTLLRTQRGVLVTAHLHQVVEVQCSRCLAPARTPLDITVEEEFFPSIDLKTGAPISWEALGEEVEDAALIDDKHILDLREVVRQELLVNLPGRILCREDCAGICPTCGADRNVEPCTCEQDAADPRWAALADLARVVRED
jgi:uncharacterized protein